MAVQLERQRARIGVVREQQVEHGGELRLGEVAPAIRHRAVGDLEQRLEHRDVRRRRRPVRCERGRVMASERSRRRPMSRKSQPCPRVMLSISMPLKAARSVIIRFRCTRTSSNWHPAVPEPEVLLELIEDAPGVQRQPIAHHGGDPADFAKRRCAGAVGVVELEQRRQLFFERRKRHRS